MQGPLKEHYSKAYGLQRDSILNTSKYFHVVEGLVPDVMHDVLEGCAQYEMKELLKYFISKKFVKLEYVNHQIENFLYAPPDVLNKPTPISNTTLKSSDHSIKQKGSQFSYA